MNIAIRFPDERLKSFTMSYDDGSYQDIRLIDIMNSDNSIYVAKIYPE